jgi:hypothetical protein
MRYLEEFIPLCDDMSIDVLKLTEGHLIVSNLYSVLFFTVG